MLLHPNFDEIESWCERAQMMVHRKFTDRGLMLYRRVIVTGLVCLVLSSASSAQSSRIKRISLMTPDLNRSIAFFTEVIGFTLDFEGTLPPGGEPFLGPVFNIDATKPIRRALLSTKTEPRGLFLIEHPSVSPANGDTVNSVVTVIQVLDLDQTLRAARVFGVFHTGMVSDVTPEGMPFSEAMITSPGGHAILCFEMGALVSQ